MTFEKLAKIVEINGISKDVHLMSDSGWEVSETEMDGVYYDEKRNTIVFTQSSDDDYDEYTGYKKLIS